MLLRVSVIVRSSSDNSGSTLQIDEEDGASRTLSGVSRNLRDSELLRKCFRIAFMSRSSLEGFRCRKGSVCSESLSAGTWTSFNNDNLMTLSIAGEALMSKD